MRTLYRIAVALVLCASVSTAYAQGTTVDLKKPITVDQALQVAFQQNPDLRSAVAQLQKARAAVNEALANFNPRFSADILQTPQGPPQSISVPAGFFGPTASTLVIVPSENTTARGNLFLPLDINRKISYSTDVARLQFQIDYLNLLAASQQLIFNVQRAYYNLLRAQGQEDVAQAAVDVAAAQLKDADSRFQVGAAPRFDVTSAEVNVANLNQQLITAKNQVEINRTNFNRTLGIDTNSPTEIVRSDIAVSNIKNDIPKAVETAYEQRPEVKQREIGILLNQKDVKVQRADLYPSFTISGNVNYNVTPSGFTTVNTTWMAVADVNIPIWNGGITTARIAEAKADVSNATDLLEETKLNVSQEVRTAALNLQEAIDRVSTTAESVSLAQESLRLARVRYNAGISILVEVTNAESALTQAQFNLINAQYDYAIALADLRRATSTQPETQKLQLVSIPGSTPVRVPVAPLTPPLVSAPVQSP